MFKRLMIISALCIGLMTLSVTGAQAWPLPYFTGWPNVGAGSIDISQLIKRVVISEDEPVIVGLTLMITQVQFQCCNHGGQCGGLGNPFDLNAVFVDEEIIDDDDLLRNGKALYDKEITNAEIYEKVVAYLPDDVCQNDNWFVDPDSLIVKQLELYLGLTGWLKDGTSVLADERLGCYTLPEGGTVYNLVEGACSAP